MATIVEHGFDISGTTAQRPDEAEIGCRYFDTTVGDLLVWNGAVWVSQDIGAVQCPVDAETVIAIGDALYLDTDDAKPASAASDTETEAGNQEAFHDLFLGIALQASAADEDDAIWVATKGIFEFTCPAEARQLGQLVGMDENGDGDALLNTTVDNVATANLAIGRVARVNVDETTVSVAIVSTVMYGGPQAMA